MEVSFSASLESSVTDVPLHSGIYAAPRTTTDRECAKLESSSRFLLLPRIAMWLRPSRVPESHSACHKRGHGFSLCRHLSPAPDESSTPLLVHEHTRQG